MSNRFGSEFTTVTFLLANAIQPRGNEWIFENNMRRRMLQELILILNQVKM